MLQHATQSSQTRAEVLLKAARTLIASVTLGQVLTCASQVVYAGGGSLKIGNISSVACRTFCFICLGVICETMEAIVVIVVASVEKEQLAPVTSHHAITRLH
jgi:acyl-CoA hydrolase